MSDDEKKKELAIGGSEVLLGLAAAGLVLLLTPIWELLELFFTIVVIPFTLIGGLLMAGDGTRRLAKTGLSQLAERVDDFREELEATSKNIENAKPVGG